MEKRKVPALTSPLGLKTLCRLLRTDHHVVHLTIPRRQKLCPRTTRESRNSFRGSIRRCAAVSSRGKRPQGTVQESSSWRNQRCAIPMIRDARCLIPTTRTHRLHGHICSVRGPRDTRDSHPDGPIIAGRLGVGNCRISRQTEIPVVDTLNCRNHHHGRGSYMGPGEAL